MTLRIFAMERQLSKRNRKRPQGTVGPAWSTRHGVFVIGAGIGIEDIGRVETEI